MLGFPGETQEQVENTYRFVEEIRFDAAFMFAYSPREPTQAARLPDQIERREKTRRLEKLIEIQNAITVDVNRSQIGRAFEVLVEGRSHKDADRWQGLTRGGKTVHFAAGRDDLVGRRVQVRATEGHLWGYQGELL